MFVKKLLLIILHLKAMILKIFHVSGLLSNPDPNDDLEEENLVKEAGKETSDSEKVLYDTSDNRQVFAEFCQKFKSIFGTKPIFVWINLSCGDLWA